MPFSPPKSPPVTPADTHLPDREAWLTEAGAFLLDDLILPTAERIGDKCERPPVRFSVGFPTGRTSTTKIAACYRRAASADGHNEIFVSPTEDDSLAILATLVHELIHACDDCESGHRKFFKCVARAVGLTGPLPTTHASPALKRQLQDYVDILGPIPHARLDLARYRQRGRYHKLHCTACGFIARTSAYWIRKLPLQRHAVCPVCEEFSLQVENG